LKVAKPGCGHGIIVVRDFRRRTISRHCHYRLKVSPPTALDVHAPERTHAAVRRVFVIYDPQQNAWLIHFGVTPPSYMDWNW